MYTSHETQEQAEARLRRVISAAEMISHPGQFAFCEFPGDGSVKRVQRAETLGPIRNITRQLARSILNQKLRAENLNQRRPQAIRPFAEFVSEEWKPNAKLAVKKSTMRYYNFQLERHILPEFGSCSLTDVNRAQVESLLSKLRQKGHASWRPYDHLDGLAIRRRSRVYRKQQRSRHSYPDYRAEAGSAFLYTRAAANASA